jgi:hypothetical protein
MLNTSELPFALTAESLADWLDLLDKLPASRASTQLSQALKQLKNIKAQPAVVLPVLIGLIPLTLKLSNSLNTSLFAEQSTQERQAKAAKLCMKLPRQLSLLFCQLAETEELDETALLTAIYHGLQMIGQCMRFYARLFEMPSATLWKKSATLYKLAMYSDGLKAPQPCTLSDFAAQTSIETVIQRNILFSLFNPTLFDVDEIDTLFLLAGQLAPRLGLGSPREFASVDFCWDLADDMPPFRLKHVKNQFSNDHLAINSRAIGHALQIGEISSELPRKSQARLALFLTSFDQIFSSIIPGLPIRSELVVGMPNISAYLLEQSKLVKIMKLSSQVAGAQVVKADMTLVPLEHQRNVFEAANHPFMQQQKSFGKTVNVLRSPNQNYVVIDGMAFDCATSDLVLLCKEQHPNALLVVRNQHQHDLTGSTHILLEKLSSQCDLYSYSTDDGSYYAIVIGENTANPEVFLASGKYAIGSTFRLDEGRILRLTACLESNDTFVRFRFSFDS